MRKLHTLLFGDDHALGHLGPTWKETSSAVTMGRHGDSPWWHRRRTADNRWDKPQPLYTTAHPSMLRSTVSIELPLSPLLLSTARTSTHDLKPSLPRASALNALEEIDHLLRHCPDLDPGRILFMFQTLRVATSMNTLELGIFVTVDALFPPRNGLPFAGKDILLRLDPAEPGITPRRTAAQLFRLAQRSMMHRSLQRKPV